MAKKKAALEGKTRTLVMVAGAIGVVGVLIGIWSWNRSTNDSHVAAPPSQVVQARAPQGGGRPDGQTSKLYDSLIEHRNAEAAEKAEASGASAMPVIRTKVKKEPIAETAQATEPAPRPTTSPVDREAYRKALETRQKAISVRQHDMAGQLALLQKAWSVQGHTQLQAPTDPSGKDGQGHAGPVPVSGGGSNGSSGSDPQRGSQSDLARTTQILARAGDTAVAVLDTPINTDDPLPMYKATIVQDGPLHGATLLGTIASDAGPGRYGSGVNFTFQAITIPGHGTASVNAFAINASDAGALKGKVNRHLWSRYAAAFGGAFLQGVGQGLLAGGRSQKVITSTNGYAVQSDAYTNKQLLMMGAANVGQVAATSMQSAINRPPTIRIPGQTTIGVFFTADLPAIDGSKGEQR